MKHGELASGSVAKLAVPKVDGGGRGVELRFMIGDALHACDG